MNEKTIDGKSLCLVPLGWTILILHHFDIVITHFQQGRTKKKLVNCRYFPPLQFFARE
jgi:hypothetical protein